MTTFLIRAVYSVYRTQLVHILVLSARFRFCLYQFMVITDLLLYLRYADLILWANKCLSFGGMIGLHAELLDSYSLFS